MTFLSANLGNSQFSFCLFDGEKIIEKAAFPLATDPASALRSLSYLGKVEGVGFCSVNPPREEKLENALASVGDGNVLKIGRDLPVGIENRCRRPERVGADRLVIARAAWERVGQKCLVLDLGTAITINGVSEKGAFLGGAISPGFGLSARALHESTGLLPLVPLVKGGPSSTLLAQDTEDAITAGIHFGILGSIEKWIQKGKEELGPEGKVVATGGDLERVRSVSGIDFFWPDLIHEGIRLICLSHRS